MYHQHRGMLPHNAMQNPRLTELLEQIKTEFESQGQRVVADGHERDTFLNQALEEMNRIQDRSRQIEVQFERSRHEYDARIRQLEHELSIRPPPSQTGHHQHGVPPAPPPSIGHGPRDLFGQIMQGGQGQNAGLGAPPPAPDQPQGLPPHLTQNAAMQNTGPPQPHVGFGGYPPAPGPGPTLNGFPGAGPPQMAASPGPGRGRQTRGPPGTGTPAQSAAPQPYGHPGSPRSHMPTPPPGQRLGPPPGVLPGSQPPMHHGYGPQLPEVGNELWKLHDDQLWPTLPPHLKKEKVAEGDDPGDKWWAVFNPKIRRELDVELVSTLLHTSVVCCVRFSRDGRYIATGCNRSAQIFDANTGSQLVQLEDPEADRDGDLYIRSVCFSPDGLLLATGAEDQMIRVWNINTKQIQVQLRGHTQDIYSLDFSANGRTIASGSGDKTVRLWDVESGTERFKLEIEDGVTTVALSADGHYVAAGSLDQTVRVWDAETAAPIERLGGDGNGDGHKDSVYSVAFSPHKDELVSGSLDKTIKHWQIRPSPQQSTTNSSLERPGNGVCLRTFSGHADYVLSVGLTHDARYVFSGSKDRGVQFWDPRTGDALLHLCGHRNSVISVAPSPTAGFFATGSGDQKARIWRYTEGYSGGF